MNRQLTRVASTVLILGAALFPGTAAAHGNVSIEEDLCVRKVGGSMVHFSAYQPQYEPKAQYCTEIPEAGDTFLVVDLVDPGLRNMPVGLRVVRGLNESEEKDQTVAIWRPVNHPDGVVRGEAVLEEGLYKLIITAEGLSPLYYQLRVHLPDYGRLSRAAGGALIGLLVLAILANEFRKSNRVRSWWSSLRSQRSSLHS